MSQSDRELAAIEWARANLATDDLEIDDDAHTSPAEGGVWVKVWVWVADSNLPEAGKESDQA